MANGLDPRFFGMQTMPQDPFGNALSNFQAGQDRARAQRSAEIERKRQDEMMQMRQAQEKRQQLSFEAQQRAAQAAAAQQREGQNFLQNALNPEQRFSPQGPYAGGMQRPESLTAQPMQRGQLVEGLAARGMISPEQYLSQTQPPKPEDPNAWMKNDNMVMARASQGDPVAKSILDKKLELKGAGATRVNQNVATGKEGPKFGTIPPGFMMKQDEAGNYTMAPVPGGPAAKGAQKEAAAQRKLVSSAINKSGTVINNVNKAIDKAGFMTTGFIGDVMSKFRGTEAFDAGQIIDTIRANISFDTLQKMREASPTGGALGSVSERELAQLERVIGSLDQGQSEAQLVENLMAVRNHYQNWRNAVLEAQTDPSVWMPRKETQTSDPLGLR